MKRILNAWPYALGVVALFALLWVAHLTAHSCEGGDGCFGMSPLDWKGLILTLVFGVFPTLAFAGAAVLGFRRGYDWTTMLLCLALAMALPEPLFGETGVSLYWGNHDWFFLAIYVVVVNVGLAVGITIRGLTRSLRRRAADQEPAGAAAP
jgi:hypothetical protein